MNYRRHLIKPKLKSLKKKRLQKKLIFFSSLGFIALIALGYVLFFYPKFKVSNVVVSGNSQVTKDEITHILLAQTSRIFFANDAALAKKISSNFPIVESVTVAKKIPNTLVVAIKEREPLAAFCQESRCFYLDKQGVIFQALENVPAGMVVVRQTSNQDLSLGNHIIEGSVMDAISQVTGNLQNTFHISTSEVAVGDTLVFSTAEGWKLYIDPTADIQVQITKLDALLNHEILPTDRKNLKYIYLQYKDKAYYK